MYSSRRLKIAIVDEELPYPANSGKRLRTLNLISRLAKRHDITYFSHRNQQESEVIPAESHLRSLGISPVVVHRAIPAKKGIQFCWRLATNLLSPLPYSVTSHTSSTLRDTISQQVKCGNFDLWQCEWTPYAELFRNIRKASFAVMAHNVESIIWQRYYESETNSPKRWYIKHQWKKFEAFEAWAFDRATRTITVSDEDAEVAKLRFGANRVSVVENGVDIDGFSTSHDERVPGEMLFLGSLDWRPNLDGLECFIREAFPKILSRLPDYRLVIVGRKPVAWLRKLVDKHPNIELNSDVPDVRPYIRRAQMMIVPLRVGGGSRLKILEAAASGLPVISTRVGAEGLVLEPGKEYLAAETIEGLADQVIYASKHQDQLRQMALSARERVVGKYDWNALADKLESVWFDCVGGPA